MGLSLLAGLALPLLLSAGTAPPEDFTTPRHFEHDLAPLLLTAVIDMHSTEYAVGRNNHELNPLGLSIGRRAVIKTTSIGGVALIVHRLHRTGRGRQARIVKYGVIAVQVLSAGWNYHHGRQEPPLGRRGRFDYGAR
jgi:hypothetical protein